MVEYIGVSCIKAAMPERVWRFRRALSSFAGTLMYPLFWDTLRAAEKKLLFFFCFVQLLDYLLDTIIGEKPIIKGYNGMQGRPAEIAF